MLCGEVHYWRLGPRYWRACLEGVRDAGLPMVGTYVPWQVHEPTEGTFDFGEGGNPALDLARFLDLCREMGLYVFLRPGPLIVSEMKHGGLPGWLFDDPTILTHNAKGAVAKFGSFADLGNPCYLHPGYLAKARAWLTKVNDVARPYFFTDGGPIVLVQLDNEISMICLDSYLASEYNPHVVGEGGLWHQWLERKYGDAARMPYKDAPARFEAVEPPRELPESIEDDLLRFFDWAEFKEDYMADYVRTLAELMRADGLREEMFAVNYNPHRPLDVPNNWHKLEQATGGGISGFDYYKRPHLRWSDFQKTALSARYSCAVTRLPWSPEWMCGIWGEDFGGDGAVGPEHTEFLYLVGLAYGLVGFNHYMFAERESWAFSAINEFGQRRYNWQALATMTRITREVEPQTMTLESRVGLLYDRPTAWLGYIEEPFVCQDEQVRVGERTVDSEPVGIATREMEGLFCLLLQLGHVPTILVPGVNLDAARSLQAVIVPCQTRLDPDTLAELDALAAAGVRVIFDPARPVKDWSGQPLPAGESDATIETGERLAQGKFGEETQEQRDRLAALLGEVRPSVASGDPDLLVTLAERDGERVLFVLNMHHRSKEATLALPFACAALEDLKTGERVAVENGTARFPVDCKQGRIMRCR